MKCDTCKFLSGYILGADECGAGHWLAYCSKNHWCGGDIPTKEEIKIWDNCKDYESQS